MVYSFAGLLTAIRLLPRSDERKAAFGRLEKFGIAYLNEPAAGPPPVTAAKQVVEAQ